MTAHSSGQQWTLTCQGLEEQGAHDDERCLARRPFVQIDVPDGAADSRVWVTAETFWEHIGDGLWDWKDLPAHERAQYAVLCVPGLIDETPDLSEFYEVIGLEGQSEAYGTLPYPGGLMSQPGRLLEAFGVIRQTRAVERMREARHQAMEMRRLAGGGHGGPD